MLSPCFIENSSQDISVSNETVRKLFLDLDLFILDPN